MIPVTLIKPTWAKAITAKTYKMQNGTPVCVKDYLQSKKYTHREVKVKGLTGFYNLLKQCADKRYIRIAGSLNIDGMAEVLTTGVVSRENKYFDDVGSRLFVIDADGWAVPDNFSIGTPEKLRKTVQHILVDRMGLRFLKDRQCVILFTSSQFDKKVINAHIYFHLTESVSTMHLHEWAQNRKRAKEEYAIDPVLFRQVQPDYISKRLCLGFSDPLPDSLRLNLHCDPLLPYVETADLLKHVEHDNHKYLAIPITLGDGTTTAVVKGTTWKDTLKVCGTEVGINDVLVTASAQLVREVGTKEVRTNFQAYTSMFLKAYTLAMVNNANPQRNQAKDRQRYCVLSKAKNYLETALGRGYGRHVDEKKEVIDNALASVIAGGSIDELYEPEFLKAVHLLKVKKKGEYEVLRNRISKELKGKVRIGDFEKAVDKSNTQEKLDDAQAITKLVDDNTFVRADNTGDEYLMIKNESDYTLIPWGLTVRDIFMRQLLQSGLNTGFKVEERAMQFIRAGVLSGEDDPFIGRTVGLRCHSEYSKTEGQYKSYYNYGLDAHGFLTTVVVDEKGVHGATANDNDVLWVTDRTAPIIDSVHPTEAMQKAGGRTQLVQYYLREFRKFCAIRTTEDYADIIAWQLVCTLNIGMQPLLQVVGNTSSGKSTAGALIGELVDPRARDAVEHPNMQGSVPDSKDIALSMRGSHVHMYDNLGNLGKKQDLLCKVATGFKPKMRILYTQDMIEPDIRKPVIITSLEPIITQNDLRNRSITLYMEGQFKGIKGDLRTQWYDKSPMMRAGMLEMASVLLSRRGKQRRKANAPKSEPRNIWLDEARVLALQLLGVVKTEKEGRILIKQRVATEEAAESMLTKGTSNIMLWLTYDQRLQGTCSAEFLTQQLLRMYMEWTITNVGLTFDLYGEQFIVERPDVKEIDRGSTRSFGIRLAKLTEAIQEITGWVIAKGGRSSVGVKKLLTRHSPLSNLKK